LFADTPAGRVEKETGAKAPSEPPRQLVAKARPGYAQILRVGLARGRKATRLRLGADVALARDRAQWEDGVREVLLVEAIEHVRLIAPRVRGAVKREASSATADTSVVPRRQVRGPG